LKQKERVSKVAAIIENPKGEKTNKKTIFICGIGTISFS